MTARHVHALPGLLAPGLLMLILPAAPAFARSADYYGPLYTSSPPIEEAQSVLKAEHYLSSGRQATGQMDEATIGALREFQRDHFIPASGLLDHETMAQLATHEAALKVAQARSSRAARQIARMESAPSAAQTTATDRQASLRRMPQTASPVPLLTGLGALLLAGGLLLSWRRRA